MSITHLTAENFQKEALEAEGKVLIDFWASWCGPCQMLAPVIEEVAAGMPDVKVCKINVDEQPDLASRYRVMSIPTLFVLKDGEVAAKSVGYMEKDAVVRLIQEA